MKKTLVAILALGSLSLGASLSDAVFSTDDLTSTTGYTFATPNPSEWTVVAALDVDTMKSYVGPGASATKHQLLTVTGANTTGGDGTIGINTNYTTVPADRAHIATTGIYGTWTADNSGTYNLGANTDVAKLQELDWNNVGSFVVTLGSKSGNGTCLTLYVTDKDGNVLRQSYANLPGLTSSSTTYSTVNFVDQTVVTNVAVFTSKLSEADSLAVTKEMSAMVLPEPATATLSLLALAGLAARRRRH